MAHQKVAWTSTSISQVHLSFTWSLENVSQLLNTKRGVPGLKVIRSPNFFSDGDEDTQWYLEFYPKGRDDPTKEFASVYITLDCAVQSEVMASYQVAVVNANGTPGHVFREDSVRFCEGDVRGKELFITRSSLLDRSKNLCPNDTLTLDCDLTATRVVHKSRHPARTEQEIPEINLANDLSTLLGDVRFSDVILDVRGREFPAHRAVLAARSSVFSHLIDRAQPRGKIQRIEIKDVDPEVLLQALKFIYSGRVDHLDSMAAALLAVADKYALDRLKGICEDYLIDNLDASDVGSVGSLYMLADLHSANQLKDRALKLMQQQQGALAALISSKS